jgi:dihydropyrimidinase
VGGTTTIIDFAKQNKGETLHYAYDTWQGKARNRTCVDYGFHVIVVEADEAHLAEVPDLIASGVTSVKMYMAYRGRMMVDDGTLFRTMLAFKENGGLVALHAENGDVIDVLVRQAIAAGNVAPRYHAVTRPPILEAEAVDRAICVRSGGGPGISCTCHLVKRWRSYSGRDRGCQSSPRPVRTI